MPAITPENLTILKTILNQDFVPPLPPLLPNNKSADENVIKNTSRALSAFVIGKICNIDPINSATSIVDDYDDCGIDAIYYDQPTRTLFIAQSKLKATEQFKQDEALSFVRGVKKIIAQDFADLNQNLKDREIDIQGALENCDKIQLVVAFCGDGISQNATSVINELLNDVTHGEERLCKEVLYFDSEVIIKSLENQNAYPQVNTILTVEKCTKIESPRITYFGLCNLNDLVEVHKIYKDAFFEKNIRTFLGRETDINLSIQNTLAQGLDNFVYLNNGITILCKEINPKNVVDGDGRRLEIKGISVINGAQTIASSTKFCSDNDGVDISGAKVSVTLILDDIENEISSDVPPLIPFGQLVTRSRNHQNPVYLADFVALDGIQEKLRRFIALLRIIYVYKATGADKIIDNNRIYVDETAQALAVISNDFRNAIYLKKMPLQFLNRDSDKYQNLFIEGLTPFKVVNAVRLNRYIQQRMTEEANSCSGDESLIYRNGNFVLAWVFSKRILSSINSDKLIDVTKIPAILGEPFDNLRLTLLNQTRSLNERNPIPPFFTNQGKVKDLIKNIIIEHFGITIDDGMRRFEAANPDGFFEHLISKAPQIENLV